MKRTVLFLTFVISILFLCLKEQKELSLLELIAMDQDGGKNQFSKELVSVLNQPFTYLGHGTQSVVFASQDGHYVVKFFLKRSIKEKRRYKLVSLLKCIPAYREKKEKGKQMRRSRSLTNALKRYAVAFDRLKEETALLGLHFSTSTDLPCAVFEDWKGMKWEIDLNRALFVLQKRVEKLEKKHFFAMQELLKVRAEKGFYDLRGALNVENYGFLEGKAILLDPGRIAFSQEIAQAPLREIEKMDSQFRASFAKMH